MDGLAFFIQEMLHWACDGTEEASELSGGYVISGKGEEMMKPKKGIGRALSSG